MKRTLKGPGNPYRLLIAATYRRRSNDEPGSRQRHRQKYDEHAPTALQCTADHAWGLRLADTGVGTTGPVKGPELVRTERLRTQTTSATRFLTRFAALPPAQDATRRTTAWRTRRSALCSALDAQLGGDF